MKNKKIEKAINWLILCILLILLLLVIITSLSKVKVEGSCKINNLSFSLNDTGENSKIENLNLSNGEISCSFKSEIPLWIILIGT